MKVLTPVAAPLQRGTDLAPLLHSLGLELRNHSKQESFQLQTLKLTFFLRFVALSREMPIWLKVLLVQKLGQAHVRLIS